MHVHLAHIKTQVVMALVNHVQLVINVQQSQTYQSYVKRENIGTKQKLSYSIDYTILLKLQYMFPFK